MDGKNKARFPGDDFSLLVIFESLWQWYTPYSLPDILIIIIIIYLVLAKVSK